MQRLSEIQLAKSLTHEPQLLSPIKKLTNESYARDSSTPTMLLLKPSFGKEHVANPTTNIALREGGGAIPFEVIRLGW